MNAFEIERAVVGRLNWQSNTIIPECPVQYLDSICYADLMKITPAGLATEIEIKISSQDWNNDLKKKKWENGLSPYVSKFIFVIPSFLDIPLWVPTKTGIWRIFNNGKIEITRPPSKLSEQKVPEQILNEWFRGFYYRYWDIRSTQYSHA